MSYLPLPPDFSVCETAENALAYVPPFSPSVPGVWIGYIPAAERYRAIYEAADAKGVCLVNSPEQYQTAMEFDRFYPLLIDLTPESVVLHSLEECASVEERIGYPVFVKGAVKSNKERGWSACVANNATELRTIAESLLAREGRSRGRIIARKLAALRTVGTDGGDFPLGREYRVFLYQNEILACGFYWEGCSHTQELSEKYQQSVRELAHEASRRVGTPYLVPLPRNRGRISRPAGRSAEGYRDGYVLLYPAIPTPISLGQYLAVDVGQLETGEWIVIEVGDAQFTGLSQVSALELWGKISRTLG
jgi:hypothetical protein